MLHQKLTSYISSNFNIKLRFLKVDHENILKSIFKRFEFTEFYAFKRWRYDHYSARR